MSTTKKKPGQDTITDLINLSVVRPIATRHLTAATCEKFNYRIRQNLAGDWEQIAFYTNSVGSPVYAKIRNTGKDGKGKEFYGAGDNKDAQLFGQHLAGSNRRFLIIAEGEIDAMSISQVFDNRYAVVSIPNGAAEAHKAVAKHLSWINGFDKVVFAFDMDAPGRSAAQKCAAMLPPGKAFIAIFTGGKDASDLLQKDKEKDIQAAIHNAQPYRPDGILDARTLTERCLSPVVNGLPWPWSALTEWTFGRRDGEVYVWGGGTGIGKTDFLAEVVASTITGVTKLGEVYRPEGCAIFSYEAGPAQIKKAIAGKIARKRFHIPNAGEVMSWSLADLQEVLAKMDGPIWDGAGKLFINDSRGAADWDAVKERLRFLSHSEGVKHGFIDPVAALVVQEDDQVKALDNIFLEAEALAEELHMKLYFASHLKRLPDGKSHEEGAQVSLNHFRGSGGIVMFTDFAFGLERNQQAENPQDRTKTLVRSLKDRYTGNSVGMTTTLYFNVLQGTLDPPFSTDTIIE